MWFSISLSNCIKKRETYVRCNLIEILVQYSREMYLLEVAFLYFLSKNFI